jgi:hypothetical protein
MEASEKEKHFIACPALPNNTTPWLKQHKASLSSGTERRAGAAGASAHFGVGKHSHHQPTLDEPARGGLRPHGLKINHLISWSSLKFQSWTHNATLLKNCPGIPRRNPIQPKPSSDVL